MGVFYVDTKKAARYSALSGLVKGSIPSGVIHNINDPGSPVKGVSCRSSETSSGIYWNGKIPPRRKPLLLKGVRQCGKTWTLKHFGEKHFANAVEFSFDRDPGLASFFSGAYDAKRIISRLSAYCGQKIVPQETLVIFDEIQSCPNALNSLKYFCEDAPEYAIAAAGTACKIAVRRVYYPR